MEKIYYLNIGRKKAKGVFLGKEMKVLKGSFISLKDNSSVTQFEERNSLISKHTKNEGEDIVLNEDIVFRSPSAAANFCTGRSSNGWREWKDDQGQTLDFVERRSKE